MKAIPSTTATPIAVARHRQKLDAASLAALLDEVQADPEVRTLRLHDAGLTPNLAVQIADFLEANRSLTALDLTGNAIGSHGAGCIAASLQKNGGTLQRLTLARCGLKSDVVAPFASFFDQQQSEFATASLQSIDLSNNQIDDDAAEALASLVLATTKPFNIVEPVALDLRNNWLSDDTMRALARALQTNTTLLTIRLEGNQDEDATIAKKQIAFCLQRNRRLRERRALEQRIRGIQDGSLMIHECKLLHVELTLEDAELLSNALCDNRSIILLELRDNSLPAEATRRILRSLERHTSVRRLRVQDNQCGDVGFSALSRLLRTSRTLVDVAVIHSVHATPLVTPLSRSTLASLYHTLARDTLALRTLTLANCALGDLEVGVVASGIAWACCLESLDLRNNHISDRSANVLARVLNRCRWLHTLDVSGNRLTLDGALPIARAVGTHVTMRSLVLGRFPTYEPVTVSSIVCCLQASTTLVRVVLATKERASRCQDCVDALELAWNSRREAYERNRQALETQQLAGDTKRAAHRTRVRQVAVRAVAHLLQCCQALAPLQDLVD